MRHKIEFNEQINWNQVYYFSIIAESGSLKSAAERLGVTSSTLSEHLSQLEDDLKLKLFQRQHRKLTLTQEGTKLFHCARQMFETGRRFIDHLTPHQIGGFSFGIGLVPGPSYAIAHAVIKKFVQINLDVSCSILRHRHDEMETALLEGKIDFGFTDRRTERPNIVQFQIFSSDLSFFVARDLPLRTLAEFLNELPLLICRSDRYIHSSIEEILEELELSPKNLILSEYPSLVEGLCREGMGVAVMSRSLYDQEVHLQRLDLPSNFSHLKEVLYATWLEGGENSEGVKRLTTLLQDPLNKLF